MNPVATRSATRPSIKALVSRTWRSPVARALTRGFIPTRREDVLVLACPSRIPSDPSTMNRNTATGHAYGGRQEQQRHREQRRDHEADDQADDPARDLGRRAAPELPSPARRPPRASVARRPRPRRIHTPPRGRRRGSCTGRSRRPGPPRAEARPPRTGPRRSDGRLPPRAHGAGSYGCRLSSAHGGPRRAEPPG